MRRYNDQLTVSINRKGVLDVDVVKGCTAGIAAHGEKGCYQACYAARIARFRGLGFSRAVVRKTYGRAQARAVERAVRSSPLGFFRIGTMGDPCHAWEETTLTVEWLAPYAIPIIITKHWRKASDDQLQRLVICGAIVNTSISALDSSKHRIQRVAEIRRYREFCGTSVARVVSCDFNTDDPIGERMNNVQEDLLAMRPMIDNPLRTSPDHHLVKAGVIRVRKAQDLATRRTISIPPESSTYLGHCSECADLCGAGLLESADVRPLAPQCSLFNEERTTQ